MLNFFKMNKNNGVSGFSMIEFLIVFVIISIISSIVLLNLSNFRNDQILKNTTLDVVSLLNKARQNTLSSINSTNYSIHFEANKVTLFTGSVYSSSDPTNEVINFNRVITIPLDGINIGGGSDLTFERLTGGSIGGSITIRLVPDLTKEKIITISNTGIISSN